MDADKARELFENGATLVFLDVPRGTEFGIDYNSWNVGPNFKGIKMITPGVHFVYFRCILQMII
jgi:A1 cistron-splicing factor AAR2